LSHTTATAISDWRARGACLTEDPELFFPLTALGPGHAQVLAAKAICTKCDVRHECQAFALSTGQEHGVWGGTSEEERQALRRGHGRAAAQPRARQPHGRELRPRHTRGH
jgi:WhiB family redox-sensing transcriptional regulator